MNLAPLLGTVAGAAAPVQRPLLPLGAQSPERTAPQESVSLSLSGPPQIAIGQEFSVMLGMPSANQGIAASVEVQFDPAVLRLAGSAAPAGPPEAPTIDAGRTIVEVRGPAIAGAQPVPAEVRFRVIAKGPQSTQIRIGEVNAVSNQEQAVLVVPPGAHTLNIVQSQGTSR
ncbi:MAG: hypothetical protein EXR39_07510 [Betaproteobacteria bacterium]|nr:hypothetical protein [Betaproteobacteria bacterium]